MKIWRRIIVGTMALVVGFGAPMSVYALSDSQLDYFAQNNILFYDPDDNCIESSDFSATGFEAFGNLSSMQVGFIEKYHDVAVQYSIAYGIPWETVMAQGILESTSGTSPFAVERNNFFGIGAYTSNPNHAYYYETPEDGWRGYYENIQKTATYRSHGVFDGDTITDPYTYLSAIKSAGYADDPNYIEKVSQVISEIEEYSKHKGWKSSNELANEFPEWRENAERNKNGDFSSETGSALSVSICEGGGKVSSGGLTLEQAKRFMMNYGANKNNSSLNAVGAGLWVIGSSECGKQGGSNCSTFSAFFMNKFTKTYVSSTPGYGREVVEKLKNRGITTGSEPRVWAVFSWKNGGNGHTGVVLGYQNGEWIVGQASYGHCGFGAGDGTSDGGGAGFVIVSTDIKVATWANSGYGLEFAYMDDQVDIKAIERYLESGE